MMRGVVDLYEAFLRLNEKTCFEGLCVKALLERSAKVGLFSSEMEQKRALYDLLAPYSEIIPPWGVLTGVRPSKRYRTLRKRYGRNETHQIMHERDHVSFEKIKKLETIYEVTASITVDAKDVIVYVHIPFCPSHCVYCSFTSYVANGEDERLKAYERHLICEIQNEIGILNGRTIRAFYVGGGTPTMLSIDFYKKLIKLIRPHLANGAELTIEAGRVDTLDEKSLQELREIGFTRISINPQSFTPLVQKNIRRELNEDKFARLLKIAKEYFTVNMDLIAGLPGETKESFHDTLSRALQYEPQNLSIHALAKKAKSELTKDAIKCMDYEEPIGYTPYYLYRQKMISGAGENTGYALFGQACLYNVLMMEEMTDVVGFGVGAISHFTIGDRRIRIPNTKDLNRYFNGNYRTLIEKIRQIKKPV